MCGIAGFTHSGSNHNRQRAEDATLSLSHRGPDQWGVFVSDAVSLGAVRLKVVDLEGGDQPMKSENGGVVIAFNGEIYNHAELRAELTRLGHRFHSRCDTEVVLRAFEQWDTACFPRLRGMFAVALWKESEGRLVLARDRMGIKPLYYLERGRDIYFGSELKAILAHPEIERRLNHHALGLYLSLNYVPGPETLVQGIHKLPPGQWLEWRNGTLRTEAYWRLRLRPQAPASLDSAKEELDWLLRESVREHLVADVPLGIWASGGLDSSTMVHYASAAGVPRLKTFSVSFRGRSFDESRYFREVAGRYGTDHIEFDLNPEVDLEKAIREISYYSDEPGADAGALPVYFLSGMTRRHVTVALSGEGADELFGGYYTYLADRYARWLRRAPAPLRRLALGTVGCWPVSDDKISFEYKLKRFLEGSLLEADEGHLFWNGTFSPAQKTAVYPSGPQASPGELFRHLPGDASGRLNRYLWIDQLFYLPDDILYKCDRMSMAHSLEVRPPFLDHRIVEFAASLPENLKIRGSRLKFLLRELMKDKVPPSVLARKKEGFDIPVHDWLRGPLRPMLLDTLTRQSVEAVGIFEWRAVENLLEDHLRRRANFGYQLWGLLTLFLWIKRWRVQTSPSRTALECSPVGTAVMN